jgi:hypothetical protein
MSDEPRRLGAYTKIDKATEERLGRIGQVRVGVPRHQLMSDAVEVYEAVVLAATAGLEPLLTGELPNGRQITIPLRYLLPPAQSGDASVDRRNGQAAIVLLFRKPNEDSDT